MIFCATGNVNHRQFVDLVKTHFNLPAGSADSTSDLPAEIVPFKHSVRQGVYQTHICAGGPALAYLSPQRYDLLALNAYLGGGMSSRLFQVIREKHGLAYSVYSNIDFFRDAGMISFYIGTDPKSEKRAVHLRREVIERSRTNALPEETIGRIREQLKGGFLLGLESANRRMTRLAKNYVYYDRQISVKEVLQRIDAINSDSVLELAQKLFNMEALSIITINPSGNQ